MSRRLLRPMTPRGAVARSLARDAFSPTFSRPPGRKSEPGRLRLLAVGGCREAPEHLPGPRQHSPRRYSPKSPPGPAASGRPVPSRARERRSLRVPRWPPSWRRRRSPASIKLRHQPSRAVLAEGTLVGGSVERSSERGSPFRSGRVSAGNAASRPCADDRGVACWAADRLPPLAADASGPPHAGWGVLTLNEITGSVDPTLSAGLDLEG